MTQNYTAFLNAYASVFVGPEANPDDASWKNQFDKELIFQVQSKKLESAVLNNGQTRALSEVAGINLADWHLLVVRCIGTGQLVTTGHDDGGGNITGNLGIYGTSVLPGIIVLSTYNLISITLSSLADGTTFEILDCLCQ